MKIGLTYPTMATIAKALLEHRTSRAKAVTHWQNCRCDPHAAEVAKSCRAELSSADLALVELQAVAPPYLSEFLKHQIDLIHPTAAAPQPANQEAP